MDPTVIRRPAIQPPAARKRVLVVGWYNHGNLGDEAFRPSFPHLWPNCDFTFADAVPSNVNEAFDAVMLGGGSFLDSGINGVEALEVPFAFVGVGAGKHIRSPMKAALSRAKAIVLRDEVSKEFLFRDNFLPTISQVHVAADLVFARPSWPRWLGEAIEPPKITVLLSEHFAPRGDCPEWVSASWQWFCRELAQVLDKLIGQGFHVQFLPMSTTRSWDDRRAAAHVISRMVRASDVFWYYRRQILEHELLQALADSRLVIAQRLHGAIFSAAIGCPVVPVIGHDKVRGFCGEAGLKGIDYYALSAATLEAAIRDALCPHEPKTYSDGAREKWRVVSAVVAKALSL